MSKTIKTICLYFFLAVLSTSIANCSTPTKNTANEDSLFATVNLDPAAIKFCFPGYGSNGQPYNISSINELYCHH
jgi:hypothetical protein